MKYFIVLAGLVAFSMTASLTNAGELSYLRIDLSDGSSESLLMENTNNVIIKNAMVSQEIYAYGIFENAPYRIAKRLSLYRSFPVANGQLTGKTILSGESLRGVAFEATNFEAVPATTLEVKPRGALVAVRCAQNRLDEPNDNSVFVEQVCFEKPVGGYDSEENSDEKEPVSVPMPGFDSFNNRQ